MEESVPMTTGPDRRELALVDVRSMRGLEIGPLASPKVLKSEGPVSYLDHASTAELREKYRDNQQLAALMDSIVDVDLVQRPGQSLTDATRDAAPFDYIVAAHVLEHVPDAIGWLFELEQILSPTGVVSLVIPDKRYTFDINRRPTDVADLLDAHLSGLGQPSYGQIYDWFAHTVTIDGMVDTPAIWAGEIDYSGTVRDDVPNPDVAAYVECVKQQKQRTPLDIHCHVFTPRAFLHLYGTLVELDLVNFEIGAFFDTAVDTFEFHVSLRKVESVVPREEIRERQRASLQAAIGASRPILRFPLVKSRPGSPTR